VPPCRTALNYETKDIAREIVIKITIRIKLKPYTIVENYTIFCSVSIV
jgi:hypothetical protein